MIVTARFLKFLQILDDHVIQNGIVVAQVQQTEPQVNEFLLIQLHDTLVVVVHVRVLDDLHRTVTGVLSCELAFVTNFARVT